MLLSTRPSTTIMCMRCRCFCDVDQVPWGLSAHDNQDPPLLFTRACHHLPAVLCWQLSLLPTIQHPTLLYSTLPVCPHAHVHMLPYCYVCVVLFLASPPMASNVVHGSISITLLSWCCCTGAHNTSNYVIRCPLTILHSSAQLSLKLCSPLQWCLL